MRKLPFNPYHPRNRRLLTLLRNFGLSAALPASREIPVPVRKPATPPPSI